MKIPTTVLVIGLLSCGEITTTDKKGNSNSTPFESKDNTSQIIVTKQLKAYLDTAFAGWTIPSHKRWDSVWFNQYNKDGNLVNCRFLRMLTHHS